MRHGIGPTCLAAALLLLAGSVEAVEKRAPATPVRETRLERLTRALAEGDVRARLAAVSGLIALGGEPVVAALAAAAVSDASPAVREEATYGLGQVGTAAATHALGKLLLDPEPDVREAAIEAAAAAGGDAAARVLAFALGDEDPALREEAVYALGEIGGEVAIGVLQRALTDDDQSVREAAAAVLAEIRPQP